jgi:hypothetical protein
MSSLGDTAITIGPIEEGEMVFSVKSGEVLRFKANGDIYVKGRLAENDKEVVEGIRAFLKAPDPKSLNKARSRFERLSDD